MTMKYSNNEKVPLSLAVWLANDTYDHINDPNVISATTLIKPVKELILTRQNPNIEKVIEVATMLPSQMGTSYHAGIEKAWISPKLTEILKSLNIPEEAIGRIRVNPSKEDFFPQIISIYIEKRMNKEIDGFTITGAPDFIADGSLEDFKSTSIWVYVFGSSNDKYIEQGSIYRWIDPTIITQDILNIRYIFTDWSSVKARQDRKYPQTRLLSQKFTLKSVEETEIMIRNILGNIVLNQDKKQEDLPRCTSKELWQRDPVWKYYKNPAKTNKSTKNFDSDSEATTRYVKDGSIGLVKHFPGEIKKCGYCKAISVCVQAKEYIDNGLLVL